MSAETTAQVALPQARIGERSSWSVHSARLLFIACVRLADMCIVGVAGLIAARLCFKSSRVPDVLVMGLLLGVLLAAHILPRFGVYDFRCITQPSRQLQHLLTGWLVSVCAVIGFLYAGHIAQELSRLWIACWLLTGAIALAGSRLMLGLPFARSRINRLNDRLAVVGKAAHVMACLECLCPGPPKRVLKSSSS